MPYEAQYALWSAAHKGDLEKVQQPWLQALRLMLAICMARPRLLCCMQRSHRDGEGIADKVLMSMLQLWATPR